MKKTLLDFVQYFLVSNENIIEVSFSSTCDESIIDVEILADYYFWTSITAVGVVTYLVSASMSCCTGF